MQVSESVSGADSIGGGSLLRHTAHVDGGAAGISHKASLPSAIAPTLNWRAAAEAMLLGFGESADSVAGPRLDFTAQPKLLPSLEGAAATAVVFDQIELSDLPVVRPDDFVAAWFA